MINLSLANNMPCIELAKALLDTTENSINSDLVKVLAEKCIADTEHYQMILSDYETSDKICSCNILDLLEEKRQLYIEVEKLKKQGFNWQPIQEFQRVKDIESNDWLFYCTTETESARVYAITIGMENAYINFQELYFIVNEDIKVTNDEFPYFIEGRKVTHFAELTPPEVKQHATK